MNPRRTKQDGRRNRGWCSDEGQRSTLAAVQQPSPEVPVTPVILQHSTQTAAQQPPRQAPAAFNSLFNNLATGYLISPYTSSSIRGALLGSSPTKSSLSGYYP